MAIHIDNLEALKQVFKEQEETEQAREKTKAEADNIKAERLKLDQRKQRHKEQQDWERLKLLQEREQRARTKEQQQAEQMAINIELNIIYNAKYKILKELSK